MAVQSLIPGLKIVQALEPAADAAGRTGAYVSLAGVSKCLIVAHIAQGNAATVQLSINQSKDTSGTAAKAITEAVPIWSNLDTGAGSTLIKQAWATSYTTDDAIKNKIICLEVDPAYLDVNNGFTSIAVATGGSNSANATEATYLLAMRDAH